MNNTDSWKETFVAEARRRFRLTEMENKIGDEPLMEIGRRYAAAFSASPEVRETCPDGDSLLKETALHCYHAGVIVALYEVTEENYQVGEKTFAVLTNMDTVFFSGLMFTRWNVKKRCVGYKTDFMAESLLKLLRSVAPPESLLPEAADFPAAMALIFAAGAAADLNSLEDPYADLSGLEES
ncbi:MAG: hypothetical protein ACOX8R_00410 [Bacillota bacterium]|jgi:hypothetical protein